MDVFDLFAKFSVDSTGFEKGIKNAKSTMSGFGSLTKSTFSSLAGMAVNALSVIGGKTKEFISSAFDVSREFEQSMAQVAATLGKTTDEVNSEIETTIIDGEEWK